ncbi:hypothetical protein BGY98DRAFT_969982 [Russula aff. rugulosa BPL654]|nr:hypothetical protein BGY98DRAFT_969982 [Russula aff. rugulosa BPL654]
MSWFDNDHEHTQAYNQFQSAPKHEAHLSHELIAGAASFAVRLCFIFVSRDIQTRTTRLPRHITTT